MTHAAVSPDGKQIAYLLAVPRNVPKEANGTAWSELHVVDTNGVFTRRRRANFRLAMTGFDGPHGRIVYRAAAPRVRLRVRAGDALAGGAARAP